MYTIKGVSVNTILRNAYFVEVTLRKMVLLTSTKLFCNIDELWFKLLTLWKLYTSASIPGELWQRFAPDRLTSEQKQRSLRVGSHQAVRHTLCGGKIYAPQCLDQNNYKDSA